MVATSAPIEDKSATEFSLRFFQCLGEKRLTIREAFDEAIGAAQTATNKNLDLENISRAGRQATAGEGPVWGLFCNNPEAADINPLPMIFTGGGNPNFVPNEKLTKTLFDSLLNAECRDIKNIHEKEEEGDYVEVGDIQTTIVNVLPYPIAIHLQKLLCPVEQENEGFDKISLRRLEQIGIVFHTTVEFMAFVMLAQLWELKLQNAEHQLPEHLLKSLRDYFYLSPAERAGFDYFPFIREIRRYFDTTHDGKGVEYFITELKELKELFEDDKQLATAFGYLVNLRRQTLSKNISQADVSDMCEEAEDKFCTFFQPLGFLHRYVLTSVQNIDIRKDRYQLIPAYNHAIVKLMRAFGKPEHNYYVLSHFLDNRGVILVKGKLRVLDRQKKEFTGDDIDFLNLSPFVIDRNAFEENTDLSNLLFYEQYRKNDDKFIFKNVKQPDSMRDRLEVSSANSFEAVYLQLDAFRSLILSENTKNVSHV